MNQFTLKTKWIAMAFAVMTLFTAYIVAGSHISGDSQDLAAAPAEAQPEAPADAGPTDQPPPEQADDNEFVDDEALIDPAGGDDPSPQDVGDADTSGDGDFGDPDSQPQQISAEDAVDDPDS